MVGPFIFLDLMGPEDIPAGEGMDVDVHPHIGLSTLTYLLSGEVRHRDSLGTVQTITAGAVNWMTAGEGITHTERTPPERRAGGSTLFGVQTWVALPTGAEDGPARFEHSDPAEVPVVGAEGAVVRVAAGTGWGERAPVQGSSPLVLADVTLSGGAIGIEVDHPEMAVVVLDGQVEVGGRALEPGWMVILDDVDRARSLRGTGRAVVIGGEPLGPRHIWWNFVHSDPERIEEAKHRWRNLDFPLVPGDADHPVPLPGGVG